ncbi:cytidine deaminase [Finegoldia magna]|uniref:cytidine deaminase n=1 Tax=Finegoldia magna TaxID=1260 RepID=UPI00399AA8EA
MEINKMYKIALRYKQNAYTPYSNYNVGCCVKDTDGNYFGGCNIENASFSPTICAERTAISKMVSEGCKLIDTILIIGDSDFTYPCGVCRQVIKEFSNEDTRIIVAKNEEDYKIYNIEELLPHGFSGDDVNV